VKILLDTCALLWAADDESKLSRTARHILLDGRNEMFLSVASVWEISVKYSQRRLRLRDPPDEFVRKCRREFDIVSLPLFEEAALHVSRLLHHHADPFDRILICQSIVHELAILSPDPALARYSVQIIW
jgi:PIN domain nuclease of toxin-antitoxin system